MRIAGIDEAGRGPLLGPLVMSIVVIDENDTSKLKSLGVQDSKVLTPEKRSFLSPKIKEMTEHDSIVVQPKEIDEAVLSDTTNLNWLEGEKIAELVNKTKPDIVYVDCPSNNIEAYTDFLKSKIKSKTKIVAEHKADAKFEVVAAASIIAKVTRDKLIEDIKKSINTNFGSGYPSDPKTKEFLKENWNKYDFFRKSWASYKNVMKEKKQKTLTNF